MNNLAEPSDTAVLQRLS